jgi:hypothetical protein
MLTLSSWPPMGAVPAPDADPTAYSYLMLCGSLFVIALGTGGIKPNVSAFGADQASELGSTGRGNCCASGLSYEANIVMLNLLPLATRYRLVAISMTANQRHGLTHVMVKNLNLFCSNIVQRDRSSGSSREGKLFQLLLPRHQCRVAPGLHCHCVHPRPDLVDPGVWHSWACHAPRHCLLHRRVGQADCILKNLLIRTGQLSQQGREVPGRGVDAGKLQIQLD